MLHKFNQSCLARVFHQLQIIWDKLMSHPTVNSRNPYNRSINPYGIGLMTIPYGDNGSLSSFLENLTSRFPRSTKLKIPLSCCLFKSFLFDLNGVKQKQNSESKRSIFFWKSILSNRKNASRLLELGYEGVTPCS